MDNKKRVDIVNQLSKLVSSLSSQEKQEIFNEVLKQDKQGVPISVFKSKLSGLELIVKYLKDDQNLSFKEISNTLNRKLSTIYNTYAKLKTKFSGSLDISDSSIIIPLDIFSDRKYSILESMVNHLLQLNLPIKKISSLLNKKESTIRTIIRRYKIKNKWQKEKQMGMWKRNKKVSLQKIT